MNTKNLSCGKHFSCVDRGIQIVICALPLMMACTVAAQLPDAPEPSIGEEVQQRMVSSSSGQEKPPRPMFNLFPDFGTVRAGEKLPPQSSMEKFMTPTANIFTAWTVVKPAFASAYKEAVSTSPELGKGASGFGRYYWRTMLDETSEDYMVQFVFPVITHQDARYYALGEGGFWHRTAYALSRAVVTRDDAGNDVFNSSEVAGSAAAAGLSDLYYPARERTLSRTMGRWGLNFGFDALGYAGREFWPDVERKLFHGKFDQVK